MSAEGIVEATERLYRSLFSAAVAFAAAMVAWGLVIAPFNSFRDEHATSIGLGAGLILAALAAWYYRRSLFGVLRRQHAWLLLAVAVGIATLWIDGGWRSSYYLASYSAVVLAAVVGGLRWSVACGALLATGYVTGLALHGYSWGELQELKDADSVIANTGGYVFAGAFLALPVAWIGGYVARINQVAGWATASAERPPNRIRTAELSVREVEVVQLAAAGMTNEQIGRRLFVSDRTIQSHVRTAMRKTGAKNRTELAAIGVREGLVPEAAHRQTDTGG